ncbi:MAG: hypothetical protein ACLP2P_12160 [Desulfobaccales bacterium]
MLGENHHRLKRHCTLLLLFLLPALLTGCGGSDLKFSTPYQAVYLDNGQVFFGRLQDTGSPYLTLRDVFYIRQQVAADKKEVHGLLLKRGGEAHAPDFMRINARHVVLIEPVAPDSRVAQLIMEAHKPPAPAPKAEPNPAPGK